MHVEASALVGPPGRPFCARLKNRQNLGAVLPFYTCRLDSPAKFAHVLLKDAQLRDDGRVSVPCMQVSQKGNIWFTQQCLIICWDTVGI